MFEITWRIIAVFCWIITLVCLAILSIRQIVSSAEITADVLLLHVSTFFCMLGLIVTFIKLPQERNKNQ